ncbi:hypothetical protein [Microbacterium sp.]|uniref:hypothetical protein n=1 Tax=Microbacterium sp. TaxID=51671 RepID=UPI001AD09F25|nr:hypothetical protein [Microbacterium sp.]MBN9223181.1 hypothetical protein [Microbacterium sp.]
MSGIKPVIRELREAVLSGMAHAKDKLHHLADLLDGHFDTVIRRVRDQDHFDDVPALPTSRTPYAPVRGADGHYLPGSLPSKADLVDLTRTDPNTAFYWSGRDLNGVGVGPTGSGEAERIAAANGGRTLEQTLAANGVDPLPVWDETDVESVRFWEDASAAFAENASGDVRAVVGSDLRPGNIWQTIEVPRLIDNPGVTSIVEINVDTGVATRL